MANFKRYGLYRAASDGIGAVRQEEFPEAASQTFKKGDFVYLVSGKVTIAAANGGNRIGAILLLGMAGADASGVTDTKIPVIIADGNAEFLIPVYHATPGSAITAITALGTAYDGINVAVSSVNAFALDIAHTSNLAFMPVEIALTDPVGAQYGGYWVKVPAAFRAFG